MNLFRNIVRSLALDLHFLFFYSNLAYCMLEISFDGSGRLYQGYVVHIAHHAFVFENRMIFVPTELVLATFGL